MPQSWEDSPAQDHVAVTPNDTTPIAFAAPNAGKPFRALFIGAAGTITVVSLTGVAVQYTVGAGARLDIAGTIVKSTGTTASGIVAWL